MLRGVGGWNVFRMQRLCFAPAAGEDAGSDSFQETWPTMVKSPKTHQSLLAASPEAGANRRETAPGGVPPPRGFSTVCSGHHRGYQQVKPHGEEVGWAMSSKEAYTHTDTQTCDELQGENVERRTPMEAGKGRKARKAAT